MLMTCATSGTAASAAHSSSLRKKGALSWAQFFFRCEIAYYHCQLNTGKDYTWEQYLEELLERQQMWNALVTAFRDALTRLDFKPAWESEELAALLDGLEQEE